MSQPSFGVAAVVDCVVGSSECWSLRSSIVGGGLGEGTVLELAELVAAGGAMDGERAVEALRVS